MKNRIVPGILFMLLLGCVDHHVPALSSSAVVNVACEACRKTPEDMVWFTQLVSKVQTDLSYKGRIYAVKNNGVSLFVVQPYVMSCLACALYDCNGNRIEISQVNHMEIISQMNDSTIIYEAL
jgi:hypothetical protein